MQGDCKSLQKLAPVRNVSCCASGLMYFVNSAHPVSVHFVVLLIQSAFASVMHPSLSDWYLLHL